MGFGDVKRQKEGCSHRKKHPHLDKPARISSQCQFVLAVHRMGVRKRCGMTESAADEAINWMFDLRAEFDGQAVREKAWWSGGVSGSLLLQNENG